MRPLEESRKIICSISSILQNKVEFFCEVLLWPVVGVKGLHNGNQRLFSDPTHLNLIAKEIS